MTLSCSVCVYSTMFQKGLMYCMICNANLLCKICVNYVEYYTVMKNFRGTRGLLGSLIMYTGMVYWVHS